MYGSALPFAVYLAFSGNCLQAFNYYQTCFGGNLTVQTLPDAPHATGKGKWMRKVVICAILKNEYFRLVGTDLTDDGTIVPGNNLSIFIQCNSFVERTTLIRKLAGKMAGVSGNIDPLINVTDKYGVRWILNVICSDAGD